MSACDRFASSRNPDERHDYCAACGHPEDDHDPADRPQEPESLAEAINELHFDRGGYCNCCGGGFPCLTRRMVNEHADLLRATCQERDTFRRALGFYANPDTYFGVLVLGDPPCGEFVDDFDEHGSPEYEEGDERPGKLARSVLRGAAAPDGHEPEETKP